LLRRVESGRAEKDRAIDAILNDLLRGCNGVNEARRLGRPSLWSADPVCRNVIQRSGGLMMPWRPSSTNGTSGFCADHRQEGRSAQT